MTWFLGDKCHEGGNDEEIYKALSPDNSYQVSSPKGTREIIDQVLIPHFSKGEEVEH